MQKSLIHDILAPDLGNSSEVLDMPWQLDALKRLYNLLCLLLSASHPFGQFS